MSAGRTDEYLIVDRFLRDFLGAQVLSYALETGLIDSLSRQSGSEPMMDDAGAQLLFGVLQRDGVIETRAGEYRLTDDFEIALNFRDLLEAKLTFSRMLAPDVLERLHILLANPDAFFAESSLFSLFDYSRALTISDENLERTKRWVDLTTALTRYEGRALLQDLDLAVEPPGAWLDIGGNSGEFGLQLVEHYPDLEVTVLDLPVVCELGRRHLVDRPGADRVHFVAGDALSIDMPESDVVSFKSMLHDWPEPAVRILLKQAFDSLGPAGRVLIFERAALEWEKMAPTFGNLSTQLFFRSYKTSGFYEGVLEALGFDDIRCRTIELETTFHVITATKPG